MFNNIFVNSLKKYYNLEYDMIDPEFVFCSVFGKKALEYDAVRIVFSGEDIIPDFNYYDYIVGYDYIQFEDRYLRWPLYRLWGKSYELAKEKHKNVNIKNF